MMLNSQAVRVMKLDFLIEPGKFRHKGVFNIINQIGQKEGNYTEKIINTFPVWFSFKESSGLITTSGELLETEQEGDAEIRQGDDDIVFRFIKRLQDSYYLQNIEVRLIYKEKEYKLESLLNYNGLDIYHIGRITLNIGLQGKF